ncbi:MAG: SpaA isopeptide-forming pilin-related protein [Acutalibacteraceae bacterium]|nr:SpaA isopeptide-forming pilin-related protein [Acutalibacteraceae bacterium]
MTKRNIPNIKKYIKKYKKRSIRHRALIAVAALVVFCTTYALILPAITMEGKVNCGKEEHIHQHNCYTKEKLLICKLEEGKIHLHEENCYNNNGDLICKADTSIEHTHKDEYGCYTTKMVMACQKIMHEHSDSCLEKVNQATETATAVTDKLTSETVTLIPTESATQEISKADNNAVVESGALEVRDFKTYIEGPVNIEGVEMVRGEISHTIYDISDPSQPPVPVPDTTIVSGKNYLFSLKVNAIAIEDGVYTYTLPANIYLVNDAENGEIKHDGSQEVGKYSATRESNIVITLEFDDKINYVSNFEGYIKFNVRIDNGEEPPEVIEEPSEPNVEKTGAFNEADGKFDFTISAVIPSCGEKGKFKEWSLGDYSRVNRSWAQDLSDADFEIKYGEETIKVPNITEITDSKNIDSNIAFLVTDDKTVYLVNKCKCDKIRCDNYNNSNNKCNGLAKFGSNYNSSVFEDWCSCWNFTKNVTLTIKYKNDKNGANDKYLLNSHANSNYNNEVVLLENDEEVSYSDITLEIPKLISKEVSDAPNSGNGYVAEFKLVVNESKVDLSNVDADNDGNPDGKIQIQDVMTNVAYIPGSIKITEEDSGRTLVYSSNCKTSICEHPECTDSECKHSECTESECKYSEYDIEYIPGSENEEERYKATLNITLKNPKACTYIITYNGQAISDPEVEEPNINSQMENTAILKFYSYPSAEISESCYFEDGWSYARRSLKIEKIDMEDPSKFLPGAVFGLFSENGYKIAEGTTNEDGTYMFETNIRKGIIFQEDKAYYLQELEAPVGYNKDDTKSWFYFTKKGSGGIKVDFEITPCLLDENGSTFEDNKPMEIKNEKGLMLPETGGCGTVIYTIAGLVLICGSAYVLYKKYLFWKRGA